MSRRFNITINARTTAGGIVTTATHFASTRGLRLALEGDSIDCPACKSKGHIKCDGPRISFSVHGKQGALSDDVCICKCSPPPKLIAIQKEMYQTIDDGSDSDWTSSHVVAADISAQPSHDLAFQVADQTGQFLAGYPYRIELPDGETIHGVTDLHGLTRKVASSSAKQAKLTVFAPTPSPIDPSWDR